MKKKNLSNLEALSNEEMNDIKGGQFIHLILYYYDNDGDGYFGYEDCDDTDPSVHTASYNC